jgi:hypothetical protein
VSGRSLCLSKILDLNMTASYVPKTAMELYPSGPQWKKETYKVFFHDGSLEWVTILTPLITLQKNFLEAKHVIIVERKIKKLIKSINFYR